MSGTILWHDYETSGIDPARDRPIQFAAVRTGLDLEERGEPVVWFARLPEDVLPDPEACLVHRLTPSRIEARAVDELRFARDVLALMSEHKGTCTAGYNSIRFDDEFTRFMLWRNLLPVYDREWRDKNSRWDLIDPIRAARALRPDGIEWPDRDDGMPSFKLEHLATANGIPHVAHDALGDVRATIALAKLMRDAQPKLFAWTFDGREKRVAESRMRALGRAPFVHSSGRIGSEFYCTSVFVRVATHPVIKTQALCVDLRGDPALLLDESLDRLRELAFTRRDELPEDAPRVPMKGVRLNRSPVFAPLDVVDDAAWQRIALEPGVVEARAAFVEENVDAIAEVLCGLFAEQRDWPSDPEEALYGGFTEDRDRQACARVHQTTPTAWRACERGFDDPRLAPLLFRLRARWFPEALDDAERAAWQQHCDDRLRGPDGRARDVAQRAAALRADYADDADALEILAEVEALASAASRP